MSEDRCAFFLQAPLDDDNYLVGSDSTFPRIGTKVVRDFESNKNDGEPELMSPGTTGQKIREPLLFVTRKDHQITCAQRSNPKASALALNDFNR